MSKLLARIHRTLKKRTAFARGLGARVAAIMFVAMIVIQAIFTVPDYVRERGALINSARSEATGLFLAAIDPTDFPSIEGLKDIGGKLVAATDIAGGTVISGAGEIRSVFGQVPELSWVRARLHGERARLFADQGMFDLFLPPETTRIPHGVILRIDVGRQWARIEANLIERAVLSGLIALMVAGLAWFVIARMVVRPLDRMRDTVDMALMVPDQPEGWHVNVHRSDQIGALAHTLNQFLFLASTTISDDLAASATIVDRLPHGVVVLSEHGHIVSANTAALKLFGASDVGSLAARPGTSLFRFEGEAVDLAEFAGSGQQFGNGEILDGDDTFPCLVGSGQAKRSDGSVLRRFLIFVDMRSLVDDIRAEVKRREEAEAGLMQLRKDIRRLRRMFDACLVITEYSSGEAGSTRIVTVTPETAIQSWQDRLEAEEEGPITGLSADGLPPILGDPMEMRRLFDSALEIVRLRSGLDQPAISVVATVGAGGMATFVVQESDREGDIATISSQTDVALLIAALSTLCTAQDGGLINSVGENEANTVAFRLKVDETSLAFQKGKVGEAA